MSREIKRNLELNESKNTVYQNLLDAMKAMNRGKFIAKNAYIIPEEDKK